jgi:predicted transcriptional regulator
MKITISTQLEAQLQQKAAAEGLTVETYVERLIREDAAWAETNEEPLQEIDPEFDEIRAAISEGLAQAERGEGKPAREVFAELRTRHGVPR